MSTFFFELPTTGAISFGDFTRDTAGTHASDLIQATSSRAAVRTALKETKRMGAEKDYLRVIKVVEDYLPYLYSVMSCVKSGDLEIVKEPIFSWRSTLSSHAFKSSPRVECTGLYYDLAFTLLTYAYSLSDLARVTVNSVGPLEQFRNLSEIDRREKDEQITFAIKLLRRSAGILKHIADFVIPEWDKTVKSSNSKSANERPADVSPEVVNALLRLTMGDVHILFILKLMSKTSGLSMAEPGFTFPKSTPSLLYKLYIHTHEQYTSARSLIQTQSKKSSDDSANVDSDVRKYLDYRVTVSLALAYKWLGIDAGEHERVGDAVAFLTAAKEELSSARNSKEKDKEEIDLIAQFLRNYSATNDTVSFQPVPATSVVKAAVPGGKGAQDVEVFVPPRPAFEASSSRQSMDGDGSQGKAGNYAGAGQYY